MPKLKEAAVAVNGTVIDIETLKNFESKQPDGSLRVVIATGDGFASIKINPEDRDSAGEVGFGQSVGWMVRFGAFARDGGGDAQATCRFIRPLNENDLDKLVGFVNAGKSGK